MPMTNATTAALSNCGTAVRRTLAEKQCDPVSYHSTSPVRFLTLSRRAMVNSNGLLLSASTPTARGASELP